MCGLFCPGGPREVLKLWVLCICCNKSKNKNNMERGRSLEGVLLLFFFFCWYTTLASRRLLLQQKFNEVIKSTCGVLLVDQALMLVRWSTQIERTNDLIQRSRFNTRRQLSDSLLRELDELSQFERKTSTTAEKENPDHVSLKHAANETRINQLEKIKS